MIIPLIGWGLIIYALVSTNMGFTIFLFLLSIRDYTEFQWWLYAYATIFSISYFLGGVGILLHKEWARWLVLVTAVIGLIGFVIALLNAASLSPIFMAARSSGINFIASLLILPASLYLKFVPFTTSVGVEGEKEIQETKVYEEAASAVSNRSAQRRYAKIVLWSIIGVGVVLPWAINLSVGGVPMSYFLGGPLSILFFPLLTVFLASPFLFLALLGRSWLSVETGKVIGFSSFNRRLGIILGGFIGTVLMTIYVYTGLWSHFDPLYLFLIPVPLFPLLGTGLGLLGGWLLSWSGSVFHRKRRMKQDDISQEKR